MVEPNDVVFADILHPGFNTHSPYKYVLIIIDGYSRFVTIYFMKLKSEANEYMMKYIAFAERQQENNVKQIITDSGGEFTNNQILEWYRTKGIIHKRLASHAGSHAAQLNLSERVNQSITNMTKAMIIQSGLPNSFWIEAMETACYIKNRIQGKGSQYKTPYELFFGEVPDIHHIRIFGSLVYVQIPPDARKKLEANCEIGYLIGYNENVIGCKVYFPETRTRKFISDYRVNESIVYGDRYEVNDEDIMFEMDENDELERSEINQNVSEEYNLRTSHNYNTR